MRVIKEKQANGDLYRISDDNGYVIGEAVLSYSQKTELYEGEELQIKFDLFSTKEASVPLLGSIIAGSQQITQQLGITKKARLYTVIDPALDYDAQLSQFANSLDEKIWFYRENGFDVSKTLKSYSIDLESIPPYYIPKGLSLYSVDPSKDVDSYLKRINAGRLLEINSDFLFNQYGSVRCLAVYDGPSPIADIIIFIDAVGNVYIQHLSVAMKHRRNGIGKGLLSETLRLLSRQGFRKVQIQAEEDEPAQMSIIGALKTELLGIDYLYPFIKI